MGKIKKLAPDEIQKIAAGEVVERPANIVKELIENSLDAGATAIAVYIENGGKTLIRIVDNGVGIARDDIDLALTHHATSKLTTVDELSSIKTFGFRGEALSSISSVSKMTFVTRDITVTEALQVIIEASQIKETCSVARDIGTDITVENLFFNVPARRKFLKSDETEWNAIYKVVHALALAHTSCGFKLFHNGRLIFQCHASDSLVNRIKILFETDSMSSCVDGVGQDFVITGFISDLSVTRYDRSSIFIFANKRWIKNSKLTHAVIKGYSGTLPPARYPCGALFIEVDPEVVDINIHPRKEEVSFLHPRRIELVIESMIKKTLEKDISIALMPTKTSQIFTPPTLSVNAGLDSPHRLPLVSDNSFSCDAAVPHCAAHVQETVPTQQSFFEPMHFAEENAGADVLCLPGYHLVGQLQQTYLMVETADSMILIDQHAAHERILYELFAKRFHEVAVISLMFPIIITCNQRECYFLEKHKVTLMRYGLNFEQCGANQYALAALPVVLHEKNIDDMIHEFLASCQMIDDEDSAVFTEKLHHALRAQMACKAAVKAGDILQVDQMKSLIDQLNTVENRFSCPHGRPTIWRINFSEIERKFKRRI